MPGPVRWVRYTGHPGSLAELASPTRGQQASGGPCTMPARRSARNLEAASAAEPFIVVPPGSLRTWSNPQANWERVQLMLGTSGGAALDADLEVSSRRLDSRP